MSVHLRHGFGGQVATRFALALAVAGVAAFPTAATAQQRPAAAARPAPRQKAIIRGFGDVGATLFSAADTFNATLGSSMGVFIGGGGEVVLPSRFFVNVHVSHFAKSGERVFVDDDGEVFPLGIDMKVGITPIEFSAGYRFQPRGRTRNMTPYVGGGIGWHRYSETSDFADSGEDVSATLTGYHALGGVEFRMRRPFALAGEAQWTTVPDAFGTGLGSASEVLDESNLGGISLRVRFVIGR
jgi:opacity protein-like surface antigen